MKTVSVGLCLGIMVAMATPVWADAVKLKKGMDGDGDGLLSLTEYVMFAAESELKQRDKDRDGVISKSEWMGPKASKWQATLWKKFNANKDEEMSASELVEVHSHIFNVRDKNEDGMLQIKEVPGRYLVKPKK